MIEWLKTNAEWIFSGVGVTIVVAVMTFLRSKFAEEQVRSGPNFQLVDTHNSSVLQNSGTIENLIVSVDRANAREADAGVLDRPAAFRVTQFAIDPSCRYKMYRFDPEKEIFPGTDRRHPAVLSTSSDREIHYLGNVFGSLDELEAFVAELKSRTNHHYFTWLKREGFTPYDVPFVCGIKGKNAPIVGQELHPVFTITVSNDNLLQTVLTRLELVIDRVVSIRSAGETKALTSLASYDVNVQSREGTYVSEMIPPLKIAGGDSVRFNVRVLPAVEQERPTGKVLIASINVCSSDYCASTPRFMLYFED